MAYISIIRLLFLVKIESVSCISCLIDCSINLDDFLSKASEREIVGLIRGIGTVAKKIGVSDVVKGGGYRSLVNVGENGGQEVPHLHFHIFGGEKVGKMVS